MYIVHLFFRIPPVHIPDADNLRSAISDALPIAIISFATTASLTKMFAKKHDYEVDSNQVRILYEYTTHSAIIAILLFPLYFSDLQYAMFVKSIL